jgi:GINS complex subunit 1
MHGDDGLKLVMEARRATLTETLPKYNDTLVRQVCLETRQLGDSITHHTEMSDADTLRQDLGLVCNLTVQHLSARRNKRCLMAYHAQRVDMLKDMYWAAGGALAHLLNTSSAGNAHNGPAGAAVQATTNGQTDADIRSKLSPHEVDFLRSYNDLILDYKSDFLDVLDLTAGIESPPGELYVDVKVIKDCGTVYTEMGEIEFRKGQRYMVRRSDIERLIVQGFLEEI